MKKIATLVGVIVATCVLASCAKECNQPAPAPVEPAHHHHHDYKGEG